MLLSLPLIKESIPAQELARMGMLCAGPSIINESLLCRITPAHMFTLVEFTILKLPWLVFIFLEFPRVC